MTSHQSRPGSMRGYAKPRYIRRSYAKLVLLNKHPSQGVYNPHPDKCRCIVQTGICPLSTGWQIPNWIHANSNLSISPASIGYSHDCSAPHRSHATSFQHTNVLSPRICTNHSRDRCSNSIDNLHKSHPLALDPIHCMLVNRKGSYIMYIISRTMRNRCQLSG